MSNPSIFPSDQPHYTPPHGFPTPRKETQAQPHQRSIPTGLPQALTPVSHHNVKGAHQDVHHLIGREKDYIAGLRDQQRRHEENVRLLEVQRDADFQELQRQHGEALHMLNVHFGEELAKQHNMLQAGFEARLHAEKVDHRAERADLVSSLRLAQQEQAQTRAQADSWERACEDQKRKSEDALEEKSCELGWALAISTIKLQERDDALCCMAQLRRDYDREQSEKNSISEALQAIHLERETLKHAKEKVTAENVELRRNLAAERSKSRGFRALSDEKEKRIKSLEAQKKKLDDSADIERSEVNKLQKALDTLRENLERKTEKLESQVQYLVDRMGSLKTANFHHRIATRFFSLHNDVRNRELNTLRAMPTEIMAVLCAVGKPSQPLTLAPPGVSSKEQTLLKSDETVGINAPGRVNFSLAQHKITKASLSYASVTKKPELLLEFDSNCLAPNEVLCPNPLASCNDAEAASSKNEREETQEAMPEPNVPSATGAAAIHALTSRPASTTSAAHAEVPMSLVPTGPRLSNGRSGRKRRSQDDHDRRREQSLLLISDCYRPGQKPRYED